MHDIVMEEFESHLSGNASRAFYDHLDACSRCRLEVAALDAANHEVFGLIREFRPDGESVAQPPLGFYNRVTYRIVDNQRTEAWGLFSPGAAFFRRVAFASLLVLATVGGVLVNHESQQDGTDAASIIAQHDVSADHPASADRDRLLVTLASYHE